MGAPTLQDIAREVGVATMTVSVVLNGSRSATRVSDSTRVRIQESAARLGYRPNAVARGLSRRCMDTLGVAAVIDDQVNLYFLEILNGVLAGATQSGQNITIFSVTDWLEDEDKLLRFCDGRVDGLLLISPTLIPEFGSALADQAPFVTVQGTSTWPGVANLEVDNEEGASLLVKHMIAQGHERIAHFTGDMKAPGARFRRDGYQRALAEIGLPGDDSRIFSGDFTIDSGRTCMSALLARPGPKPTAVFCANDAMAYGALETMARHGLRAPDDISIGGFDDLMLAQMTTPHLTTVRQPFREMGRRAVELLLSQLRAPAEDVPELSFTPVFKTELIVRDSVGPPQTPS